MEGKVDNTVSRVLKTLDAMTDSFSELYQMTEKNTIIIREQDEKISRLDREVAELKTLLQSVKLGCPSRGLNGKRVNSVVDLTLMGLKETMLTASKGEAWKNHHSLNSWLQEKLRQNAQKHDCAWKVLPDANGFFYKVEFVSPKDRDFILKNKQIWDYEGIWKWDEFLTYKEREIKDKLMRFGLEQRRQGKSVQFLNRHLVINGEKWVWVDKVDEILKCKVAKHLDTMKMDENAEQDIAFCW